MIYSYLNSKNDIYNYIVYENILVLKPSLENDSFKSTYFAICQSHVSFSNNNPLYFESMIGSITESQNKSDAIYNLIYKVGEDINEIIGVENIADKTVDVEKIVHPKVLLEKLKVAMKNLSDEELEIVKRLYYEDELLSRFMRDYIKPAL